MTSLPETAAKAAKQLWKSKPGMDLRITKARKPEWLAQNLDNPFRGWDGAEHIPAAAAKKAARSISLPPLRKRQPINTARPVPS